MRTATLFAAALAALAIVAVSSAAAAGDNVECYTAPAAWNVPKGGVVVNRGSGDQGPVGAVIDTLGEHWTHSETSHGADSSGTVWGSFSTMKLPRTYPSGNSSCNTPIDSGDAGNGWPGVRTDDGGGLWAYYFSDNGSNSPGWNYQGSYGAGQYLGCYADSSTRALPMYMGSGYSVESCDSACAGHRYFGVQWYGECYCGDDDPATGYARYGGSGNCNTPCNANSGETCGGGWANSVYSVSGKNITVNGTTYATTGGWAWGQNGQADLRYVIPSSTTTNYMAGCNTPDGSGADCGTYKGNDLAVAQCMTNWEKNVGAGCSGHCLGNTGYNVYAYSFLDNTGGSTGLMCSGAIAFSQWQGYDNGFCAPTPMRRYTYGHAIVAAASNNLYNAIDNGITSIGDLLGDVVTCITCFDCNIKDEGADQMVNCFAYNQGSNCTRGGHGWANDGSTNATSISPARVVGDYGHYGASQDGNGSANNSPWKLAAYNAVQWNAGGAVYGCWY